MRNRALVYCDRSQAQADSRGRAAGRARRAARPPRALCTQPIKVCIVEKRRYSDKKQGRGWLKKKKEKRAYIILQVIPSRSRPNTLTDPSDPRFGQNPITTPFPLYHQGIIFYHISAKTITKLTFTKQTKTAQNLNKINQNAPKTSEK